MCVPLADLYWRPVLSHTHWAQNSPLVCSTIALRIVADSSYSLVRFPPSGISVFVLKYETVPTTLSWQNAEVHQLQYWQCTSALAADITCDDTSCKSTPLVNSVCSLVTLWLLSILTLEVPKQSHLAFASFHIEGTHPFIDSGCHHGKMYKKPRI